MISGVGTLSSDTSLNHSSPTLTSGKDCCQRTAAKGDYLGNSAAAYRSLTAELTIAKPAASALVTSPSFEVTATTMFRSGMNATSAYHSVFEPLCQ